MKKNSFLTIPCHWDMDVLNVISEYEEKNDICVKEMYGVASNSPIRHGRNPSVLKSVQNSEMQDFRNLMKKRNIDFAYILNSPLTNMEVEKDIDDIKNHIKWVLRELNPNSFIIASLEIMKIVRELTDIPITISTIAGVRTIDDLKEYLEINPSKLVVQHDVNRNFKDLKKLVEFVKNNNISIEVMLTESCRRRCPMMKDHYRAVGKGERDSLFHKNCNIKKIESPEEFLLANFIRPEDISFYEDLGIRHFKITGRSKDSSWLPQVVKAYLDRSFSGNLIRLLGIDPCLDAEEWIYISNSALNGFVNKFPMEKNAEDEKRYCRNWIKKLYTEGNFRVDRLDYEIVDNVLCPSSNVLDIPRIKFTYFNKK